MYCKYCGNSIDNDSLFCSHCGRKIIDEVIATRSIEQRYAINNIKKGCKTLSLSQIGVTKENILKILTFIWKVLKTIVLVIGGIICWTIVGFVMAPFIALFNVDFPEIGIFDEIVNVWKKDKNTGEA